MNKAFSLTTVMERSSKELLDQANKILENLKEELLQQLMECNHNPCCNPSLAFPWLEEDTEYQIKMLKLNKNDERRYIIKVHRIMGQYSETRPYLKRNSNGKNQD